MKPRSIAVAAAFGVACAACGETTPTDTGGTGEGSVYEGSFSGTLVEDHHSPGRICRNTYALSGTLRLTLKVPEGSAGGTLSVQGDQNETGVTEHITEPGWTFAVPCPLQGSVAINSGGMIVTGTPDALVADLAHGAPIANRMRFTGALHGTTVTGKLVYSITSTGTGGVSGKSDDMAVTLTQTLSGR